MRFDTPLGEHRLRLVHFDAHLRVEFKAEIIANKNFSSLVLDIQNVTHLR